MTDTKGRTRRNFLATTLAGTAALSLQYTMAPILAQAQRVDEINWPNDVRAKLASRLMRLQHYMWHTTRNTWYRVEPEARERVAGLEPKWVPPRPSYVNPKWDTDKTSTRWATTNGSGADFIYMHRQMIRVLNTLLQPHGLKVVSWNGDQIPPPVPADYPRTRHEKVPPAWTHPSGIFNKRLAQLKSDAFFYDRLSWWDHAYKDFSHLRKLTLGELGARMELDVHNSMHIRWSEQPINPNTGLFAPAGRPHDDIPIEDASWDSPLYDTILDEYSSHIPQNFWRLHKWIDNRIHDWAEAHGSEVKTRDYKGVVWFEPGQWVEDAAAEPWVGPFDPGDDSDGDQKIRTMETVFNMMTGRLDKRRDEFPAFKLIGLEEIVTGDLG